MSVWLMNALAWMVVIGASTLVIWVVSAALGAFIGNVLAPRFRRKSGALKARRNEAAARGGKDQGQQRPAFGLKVKR
jgi:beta-lactamase regulating signal transducer with metallopeptidase domain